MFFRLVIVPVPPDLFDQAFEIWQEFGPQRRRPVEQRWRERLPALDRQDHGEVAERCRAVEAGAFDFATAMLNGELAEADAVARLRASFPDLTEERVSRAWSQSCYFASK